MTAIPKRAIDRITTNLRRFQSVLADARSRDVNESDTAVIVTDLLHEFFGYDKYAEITTEYAIRNTYCDLAIKLAGRPALLVEIKAIGLELKDQFLKQAVDYAANEGVEWVALTNGAIWRVYRVHFRKPIEHELVLELDFLAANARRAEDLEKFGLLAKESWQRDRMSAYYAQCQALSRFTLGALLVSDPITDLLRREIRRLAPQIRVQPDAIKAALCGEVIKREVMEGERAAEARRQVSRAANRAARRRADSGTVSTEEAPPAAPPGPSPGK